MAYWHMQLHPDDKEWGREKELLEKKALIGLGLTDSEQAYNDFKSMQIDDIVLIKHGANPIALVKVIGELEYIKNNDFSQIDWFQLRRKVEILEFADSNRKDFPQPRKTLQKAEDAYTPTYQYIDNWYKSITPDLENMQGLKLRKLYIEKHNMFKDFNISFAKDNKTLPIIILAGINGTGKTTILEYLNNFISHVNSPENKSFIKFNRYDEEKEKIIFETLNYENTLKVYKVGSKLIEQESQIKKYFQNNIVYLKTDTHHHIKPIEDIIVKYLKLTVWEENNNPTTAYKEIVEFINEIFAEFNLNIMFDSLSKDEKVIFKNKNGDKFPLDKISTGEKTLLSKAFYLYIQNIKDKVVLIDEPELSLHPSWQNKILKLYEKFTKDYNCQIIIATHSPHIIASAKNEYIRVLQVDKESNQVKVINDLKAHGRDINSVLFDVMGEVLYRPDEFRKKIDRLYYAIEEEKNHELSMELLRELEEDYGASDSVILEAKMLLEMMTKENQE